MWTTRIAAVTAVIAVFAPGSMAAAGSPHALDKRCRACPLIVPECHACPDGQRCHLSAQSCEQCAQAVCVADSASSSSSTGSLAPLVTTGITPFPTMKLPPGVTPSTVPASEQTAVSPGGPLDTNTDPITTHAPIPVTPSKSGAHHSSSASTTAADQGSSSSAAASAAATTSASSSTSAGAAAKHAAVPWAIEVLVAAVGVLAL